MDILSALILAGGVTVCVLMLRFAWRNCIPRAEWLSYCLALAMGFTILGGVPHAGLLRLLAVAAALRQRAA